MNTNTISTLDYLNGQLIDAIELARKGGTNVFEFTKEQVPDVLHQLVIWNATYNCIWLAVGVIGILASALMLWLGYKKEEEGALVIGLVALVISFIITTEHVKGAIQPIVAPKVFLIEYARDLVKGGK